MAFYLIFGLCFLNGLLAKSVLPDTVPICYRNDPNLNDCLLKATETIRPQTLTGVPELGLPSIEPYVLPKVTFDQASNSLDIKMELTNLTIHGLSNYKFTQFDFDPKTLTWHAKNSFQELRTTSQCKFAGKILIIPLQGEGTLLVTSEPNELGVIIEGRLKKLKGVDYYDVTNVTIDIPVKKAHARFENFVGINPQIIEAVNKILEENSEEFIKELFGTFTDFLRDFAKSLYSRVVRKVPYDELFPISDKFPPLSTN